MRLRISGLFDQGRAVALDRFITSIGGLLPITLCSRSSL
jgi:hypothetical protein